MEASDTDDRQMSSGSVETPEERYIRRINTDVYGNKDIRETLWTILRIANSSSSGHITKQKIAEKANTSVQDLYNYSALTVLERFGVIELVPKVNRTNEAYVLIDEQFCCWLDSAPDYGPAEPPDRNKFPHARNKVECYGQYIDILDKSEVESDDGPSPVEINFELIAQELGVGSPISALVRIESEKMNEGGSTIKWRFKMEGSIEGEFENVLKDKIVSKYLDELFKRVLASLHKHRVKCPCETVREHLINLVAETASFVKEDVCYVESDDEEGVIHFRVIITKIVSDNND